MIYTFTGFFFLEVDFLQTSIVRAVIARIQNFQRFCNLSAISDSFTKYPLKKLLFTPRIQSKGWLCQPVPEHFN